MYNKRKELLSATERKELKDQIKEIDGDLQKLDSIIEQEKNKRFDLMVSPGLKI